jgi:hypothetical protein
MYYITKELEIIKDKKSRQDENFTYFEKREDIDQDLSEDYIDGDIVRVKKVPNALVFTSKVKAEEKVAELKQEVILQGIAIINNDLEELSNKIKGITSTMQSKYDRDNYNKRSLIASINNVSSEIKDSTKLYKVINYSLLTIISLLLASIIL